MEGFGGSFTDSSGININKLSPATKNNLLRSYFGSDGLKYNLGRVPIAGTDFSTKFYTYDDVEDDIELKYFKLTSDDYQNKIPLMKEALKLNPAIKFTAAAWTAPVWMKSRKKHNTGHLLGKYYQTFANYIVKFLEEYKKEGLEIWTVSTGNEPFNAFFGFWSHLSGMYWSPNTVSKWIIENLGPSIKNSNSSNTKILLLDDTRVNLPWFINKIKKKYDNKVLKYVSGIGVHPYTDWYIPAIVLDITHGIVPDKFLLITEDCTFRDKREPREVELGSWHKFDKLVRRMFQNINHWIAGWIDWNLALDSIGGPNWTDNYVDPSIIVIPENDIFYKQPMFYAMAHFSKFIERGAHRIKINSDDDSILITAFIYKEQVTVILYNSHENVKKVSINLGTVGFINTDLPEFSLTTILYKIDPESDIFNTFIQFA